MRFLVAVLKPFRLLTLILSEAWHEAFNQLDYERRKRWERRSTRAAEARRIQRSVESCQE